MGPNGLKVKIVVLIQLQRALHDPSGEKRVLSCSETENSGCACSKTKNALY